MPVMSSTVGRKSTTEIMCCLSTLPGRVTPGQRTIHGVRVLGWYSCVLANGSGMPWSDINITTVFSASPLVSSAFSTAPTASSARRTLV